MNIAIEGCLHGELDRVYQELMEVEKVTKVKIDALLICGDFQAIRDAEDLDYMHCPPKYKQMGGFHNYYSGDKKAPYLTIFIGGNHEAVNYMRDLYFGGWAAPNIYFLGQAGSIFLRKGAFRIRISGASGIYNHRDFKYCLKTERIPLYGKDRIQAYHLKQLETFRLQLFSRICMMKSEDPEHYGGEEKDFDIFLSHDWPQDIALYGNMNDLMRKKGFLKEEIQERTFGSPPMMKLMKLMKPSYWFSAHIHVKYTALFPHQGDKYTHFLALDKCLQKKPCLQIIRIVPSTKQKSQSQSQSQSQEQPAQSEPSPQTHLQYDNTWLWVIKATSPLQKQNKSYYKYQHKQLKLLNTSLMNELIESYSKEREEFVAVESKQIEEHRYEIGENNEIEQTRQLLTSLGVDLKIFEGVLFSHQHQHPEHDHDQQAPGKQAEQINDEIDLDL